jgi:hypothetical protein
MVTGQPAHVAKAPPFYAKGVVVELKREIVEGNGGKGEKVASRPPIFSRLAMLGLHSILTFILHCIVLLSCSLHWPKASKAKSIPFIIFQSSFYLFFLKFLDFILCNDEINTL